MGESRGPIFYGRPSPSLRRMRQMKPGQLREHLAKLRREAENRQHRLDSLRAAHGHDQAELEKRKHMFRVSKEIERLQALIDEGWRIHEKQQHTKRG